MNRFHRYRLKTTLIFCFIASVIYIYWQKYYASDLVSNTVESDEKKRTDLHLKFNPSSNEDKKTTPDDFRSLPSVYDYCNSPTKMSLSSNTDENLNGYTLQQVQVIIRHGDRTPLRTLADRPNPRVSCKFTEIDKKHFPQVSKFMSTTKDIYTDGDFESWSHFPNKPFCHPAELTPVGAIQHLLNGEKAKQKYINYLRLFSSLQNFTPDEIADLIIVKSTEYSRTFQSANAFMFGFLSDFNQTNLIFKRSSRIDFCSEKESKLPCKCPGLSKYSHPTKKMRRKSKHTMKSEVDLKTKIGMIYNMNTQVVPPLTHIMDVLVIHACHGLPLPCKKDTQPCVDLPTLNILANLITNDEHHKITYNENYVKTQHLRFHPLLTEIYDRMKNLIKRRSVTKFVLYSGHDLTLSPMLILLGLHDGKWPPFASTLSIELYSKKEENKIHYFLKFIYNGKDRTSDLKFCKGLSMCKFIYFQTFAKMHLIDIGLKMYTSECFS